MMGLSGMAANVPGQEQAAPMPSAFSFKMKPKPLIATGAVVGAGTGASVGTAILPGVGTAIGAAVGTLAGAIPGIVSLVKGDGHARRMASFGSALAQADADADLKGMPALMTKAQESLGTFKGLLEKAQKVKEPKKATVDALKKAATVNQSLAERSGNLARDAKTYSSGAASIDPWNLKNPALLALQRLPAAKDEVKDLASKADTANRKLKATLSWEFK